MKQSVANPSLVLPAGALCPGTDHAPHSGFLQ